VGELEPWSTWASRWERFQEGYVPCREEQIEIMLRHVAPPAAEGPTALLDIASGPGSISRRALRLLPATDFVNVDADPWLLALGRRSIGDDRVTWVEADLRDQRWTDSLPLRRFDAVVTMTAMHWFDEPELRRLYRDVALLLAPGGRFVCGDLIPPGAGGSPAGGRALERVFRWQAQQTARGDREDWVGFWRAARAEPVFREVVAYRDRRIGRRRPRRFLSFHGHADALAAAGFHAVDELWRRDAAAILAATR